MLVEPASELVGSLVNELAAHCGRGQSADAESGERADALADSICRRGQPADDAVCSVSSLPYYTKEAQRARTCLMDCVQLFALLALLSPQILRATMY